MRSQKNIQPAKIILTLIVMWLIVGTETKVLAQFDSVKVPAGSFHSVMPEVEGEPIFVDAFFMDVTAVTNEEYIEFLKDNEEWKRSGIPTIFTNSGYLSHWVNDLDPDLDRIGENRPVTRISWFAANEYCGWKGGRLPTLNEWEYSAQLIDFDSPEEMNRFSSKLIGWYSGVDANNIGAVGTSGIETRFGVKDQFGLIMEWVQDFKPVIADDLSLDCGTVGRMQEMGSVYSYAASIRYITRMSFNAKSTTGMMGFRCAYDVENLNEQEANL